jgi:hypothetical protein
MFDVPIELAAALCGYRPDQVGPNGEDPVFTLLMRPLPPREPRREGPGWLARLFGARGGD